MTEMDYRAEAEEAHALVDTLLERVREGDESVTPEEIDNARKLAEFAELRGVAAERKAWAAARDLAAVEQEEAALALKELLAVSTKEIDTAQQKAAKAFDTLMAAVDSRWIAAFRAARRLRIANEAAAEYDLPGSSAAYGVGYDPGRDLFRVVTDRGSYRSLELGHLKDPEHWLRAVIEPARVHLERGSKVTSTRRPDREL